MPLLDGHALARSLGFHVPCLTRPCYTVVTVTLAELDPVLTAAALSLIVITAVVRLVLQPPLRLPRACCFCVVMPCLHALLTIALLLPRPFSADYDDANDLSSKLPARECIAQSSSALQLRYPSDAEAHFAELHAALGPWIRSRRAARACGVAYCGDKVEDGWIRHFARRADQSSWPNVTVPTTPLRTHFGAFIPILVPWNRLLIAAFGSGSRYPRGLLPTLYRVLRRDVLYVTVAQDDQGWLAHAASSLPNVLVLSAGGYGHVPIPLLNQPESTRLRLPPPSRRRYLVSYVGSLEHPPHNLRVWMMRVTRAACWLMGREARYYYGPAWRETMAQSIVSLAPRGFGRTAYHVAETLQLGLLPVHVYSDRPWLPYPHLYARVGFTSSVLGLPSLLWRIARMSDEELLSRETSARALAASHFTVDGVARQIGAWLLDQPSDLRCTRMPSTVRDEEAYLAALALGLAVAGLLLAASVHGVLSGMQSCRRERRGGSSKSRAEYDEAEEARLPLAKPA